jgi:hypothetical protein
MEATADFMMKQWTALLFRPLNLMGGAITVALVVIDRLGSHTEALSALKTSYTKQGSSLRLPITEVLRSVAITGSISVRPLSCEKIPTIIPLKMDRKKRRNPMWRRRNSMHHISAVTDRRQLAMTPLWTSLWIVICWSRLLGPTTPQGTQIDAVTCAVDLHKMATTTTVTMVAWTIATRV